MRIFLESPKGIDNVAGGNAPGNGRTHQARPRKGSNAMSRAYMGLPVGLYDPFRVGQFPGKSSGGVAAG